MYIIYDSCTQSKQNKQNKHLYLLFDLLSYLYYFGILLYVSCIVPNLDLEKIQ